MGFTVCLSVRSVVGAKNLAGDEDGRVHENIYVSSGAGEHRRHERDDRDLSEGRSDTGSHTALIDVICYTGVMYVHDSCPHLPLSLVYCSYPS